ncbi:hypothetical protein Tco_0243827 [Tanacetum coccineum]
MRNLQVRQELSLLAPINTAPPDSGSNEEDNLYSDEELQELFRGVPQEIVHDTVKETTKASIGKLVEPEPVVDQTEKIAECLDLEWDEYDVTSPVINLEDESAHSEGVSSNERVAATNKISENMYAL